MELLLSKSTMPVISWIAQLLGWVMNGIYEVLNMIGIPNIGLAIIIFTIIVYIVITPLQVKTQKMSKIMAIVQPEMNQIQKKYAGKKDTISQQKMQEETMGLYQKYGVSPTGSCLPMLIQLPIFFALYQVIYHIPGYISKVADLFNGLAVKMMNISGGADAVLKFITKYKIRNVSTSGEMTTTKMIDFLYMLKPSQWEKLSQVDKFSSLQTQIHSAAVSSEKINTFLGINISDSPWDAIKAGFGSISSHTVTTGIIIALIAGILVPVLAWFTQWLNYKLMPQQQTDKSNTMANSMQSMNTIMPIFSAFMCLTLSMGIGIYWIVGAVVRSIQQVIINRKILDLDPEVMIQAAQQKQAKKREKEKGYVKNAGQYARRDVKNIPAPKHGSGKEIQDLDYYKNAENVSPNSLMAKANMVRRLDEKNAEKKNNSSKKN